MALQWYSDGNGDVVAMVANDADEARICSHGSGHWTAVFRGETIKEGQLVDCIKACNIAARTVRREALIASLRRQLHTLQMSEGGNWRRIRAANVVRRKIDHLVEKSR